MEFDKSRVYTALNADELKVGSVVIVADDMLTLKERVAENQVPRPIEIIGDEGKTYRFIFASGCAYALAYLVFEPKELKWTDLSIGDVVRKKDGSAMAMVTHIDLTDTDLHVQLGGGNWFDNELLADWEKVEDE